MIRIAFLAAALAGSACSPGSLVAATQTVGAASNAAVPTDLPPLYADELGRAKVFVDGMMADGLVVPQPKDPGGGYTHEQHKRNYKAIYLGGQLYRATGQEMYRDYVRDLLLRYAEMYPTLGDHPAKANQNVGRLFWQVRDYSQRFQRR